MADFGRVDLAALTPLNFRVPEAFHREFKLYAVQHGVSMGGFVAGIISSAEGSAWSAMVCRPYRTGASH
jgi:hypothetical protein